MHTSTTFTRPEWIAILNIATSYQMSALRARAISEVYALRDGIDPVEWVLISEKNDVPEWLLEARTAICSRKASLTSQELDRLGSRNSSLIMEVREAILWERIRVMKDRDGSITVRTIVDKVFGREERELQQLQDVGVLQRQEGIPAKDVVTKAQEDGLLQQEVLRKTEAEEAPVEVATLKTQEEDASAKVLVIVKAREEEASAKEVVIMAREEETLAKEVAVKVQEEETPAKRVALGLGWARWLDSHYFCCIHNGSR